MFVVHICRVLTRSGLSLKDNLPGESATLAEALMAPTVIYVKQVEYIYVLHMFVNIIIYRWF